MSEFLIFIIRKKWRRLPVVVLCLLIAIFILTQTNVVFHYPVKNANDLYLLEKSVERDYLYVEKTENEISYELKNRIKVVIDSGTLEPDTLIVFKAMYDDIDKYPLEDFIKKYKSDKAAYAYLSKNKSEINMEYKTYDEVNMSLLYATQNLAYQKEFQANYLTYVQAIIGFLMIAYVILIIKDDDRYRIRESINISYYNYSKYYIVQILTLLLPLSIFVYIFGLGINLYSYLKFVLAGYNIKYLPMTGSFILYFIPTLLCFSSILILIISTFKNYLSVIPFYIIYVIFNVTPNAMNLPKVFQYFRILHRLDIKCDMDTSHLIVKQLIVVIISIILFCISYTKQRRVLN